jgi:hypothetical protein
VRLKRLRRACRRARRARRRAGAPADPTAPAPTPEPRRWSAQEGFRWGLDPGDWGRLPDGPALDRMAPTGIRWIREEFNGPPDSISEGVYRAAAGRGIRVLPLLQTSSMLPDDVNGFARMVAAHTRRYGPGGTFWTSFPELDGRLASSHFEIYNEPYGDWYGPVEPARYARLLATVVPAARRANPRARFLMAVDWTPDGERRAWIDQLYATVPGLNALFDAVAMHPYSGVRSPDQAGDPWGFKRLTEARRTLVAHGAVAKPFWITELGWSTCPDNSGDCVSEAQQADYIERAGQMLRQQYGFVEALFVYHFSGSEANPADPEDFYGLVRRDLSPKPAFHALRRVTGAAR